MKPSNSQQYTILLVPMKIYMHGMLRYHYVGNDLSIIDGYIVFMLTLYDTTPSGHK